MVTEGGAAGPVIRSRVRGRLVVLACAFLAGTAQADLTIPAGSVTSLGSGTMDLACTDVVVAGTLQVNTGSIKNVRNLSIQAGGILNGGSGLVEVGGNWTNGGSFVPGTGTVNFRDLCSPGSATITGSTTFYRASFVTATGRNYVFAVGSTQTVTSVLEISGTASNPIQFRSSAAGQVAFINLLIGGTQLIQHVGVTDVWATGQWLAPFQTNEGGGGNAHRWFGTPGGGGGGGGGGVSTAIPTLGNAALAALAALLAAAGSWFARQRAATKTSTRRKRDRESP
jgi:hypothetical protein